MKTLCIKWLLHDMELMAIKIVHVCLLVELKLFMFMEVGSTDSKTFKLISVWWVCEWVCACSHRKLMWTGLYLNLVIVVYMKVAWVYNVYIAKVIAIDISHIYSLCADMIDMQTWNFKTFKKPKYFIWMQEIMCEYWI